MSYQYVRESLVKNKTVLLRVDINEPLDDRGRLLDDFRIRAIIPTIKTLQKYNCNIIIGAHLGRPEGKLDKALSLQPMAERIAELLNHKFVVTNKNSPTYPVKHLVFHTGDITKKEVRTGIKKIAQKEVVVLENLRFYSGEENDGVQFSKQLADLADVFINDAFAVSHRAAASIVGVTKYLPSFAGPVLEQEIKHLDYVMQKAKKPFVLMMGGIKISDKAKTLENLGKRADKILIGGGIANLLLQSDGLEIGQSKVEADNIKLAWKLRKNFKDKIVLPKDLVVADKNMSKKSIRVSSVYDIKPRELVLDIGPKTILEFAKILKSAKTITWNGPMGFFEQKPFRTGTFSLSKILGGVGKGKAFVVVGGGETVTAIRQSHQNSYVDHLSTGGGAMLEYLAGNKLPGLTVLKK